MPKSVRLLDDPVLRRPCEVVDMWEAEVLHDIEGLLKDMHETMIAERGAGLAANQIGRSLRVFILKEGENSYKEYINPEITAFSDEVQFENEGCLSLPGTMGTTNRFRKVSLKWVDRGGQLHTGDFEDFKAFAVQHEMDHLNGKLYIDQFSRLKREMVVKKHKKFIKFRG